MRLQLSLVLALFLATLSSRAGMTFNVRTEAASGISLRLDSWLESCPPSGLVPLTLRASNSTTHTQSWDFTVSENSYGAGGIVTRGTLTVEAGHDGALTLYAMTRLLDRSYGSLNMSVAGSGVQNSFAGGLNVNFSGGSNQTEFIGMSKKLAAKGWSALKAKLNPGSGGGPSRRGGSSELQGSELDMTQAPTDWRGYTALAQLWMDESDWLGMSTQSKAALLDWVTLGGVVGLLVKDESNVHLDSLKILRKSDGRRGFGAGAFRVEIWDGVNFPTDAIAKNIRSGPRNDIRHQLTSYSEKWPLRQTVGDLGLKSGLVFGFVAIFGLLIGPVNLFVLAGPSRRQRLFWTTPLLSIAASVLLIVLMILQDGIGGNGSRLALAILQPEEKKMALVQEQVSRTGVLLGSSFDVEESAWTQPLALTKDDPRFNPFTVGQHHYAQDGGTRTGDWFSSRAIQSQLIETVRPSRAAIEFFPAAETGAAPAVVSAIEIPLEKLFIIDDHDLYWTVEGLGTGQKKTMQASTAAAFNLWINAIKTSDTGPVTKSMIESCVNTPGYAYAETKDASRLAVKTLPSIRWNKERVVFMGPYVEH